MTARMTDIENGIWFYRMFGDTERLAWVLRSDRPLTAKDRNLIADFIEGKIKLPRSRPPLAHLISRTRIKNMPMRAAAGEVERLKAEMRKTTGRTKGNHDKAIKLAVQKYCPPKTDPTKFEEKLQTFLRRPKSVRDAP